MKTYINRFPVKGPWGGGAQFINNFYKEVPNLGHEVCRTDDFKAVPDVVFLLGIDGEGPALSAEQAIAYKMYAKPDVKLILRVNENDARKATRGVDAMWRQVSEYVDGTVFVSNWIKDYFLSRGWVCKNNVVIYNGVDRDVFKPHLKLDNNKINIVSHHWSDNVLKGADIYEKLDEFVGQNLNDFSYTFIGRQKSKLQYTNIVSPLYGETIGAELGKHDVYVSASRWDPGPNHICESISCELPTYVHVDGGGAVEFAGFDHIYRDWEELKKILLERQFRNNSTSFGTWKECIRKYVEFSQK